MELPYPNSEVVKKAEFHNYVDEVGVVQRRLTSLSAISKMM